MKREEKNYTIGLDIGTASVGWAVINDSNELIKKGNNPLWGYSIFEEGKTAKNRRQARSTRRRYVRRKQRIHLLQDLCSEMIYPIDKMFFKRLKNSYLVDEDRDSYLKNGGILFNDYETDAKFYDKYPTIYHLRKHLTTSEEKEDPRYIYLALHHIVKYRGNFLYEGQKFNLQSNDTNTVNKIEKIFEDLNIDENHASKIYSYLTNNAYRKKEKQEKIESLIEDKDIKKLIKEITKALLGYKFNPGTILNEEHETTISFSDSNYEEKIDELSNQYGEKVETIYELHEVYSSLVLKDILKNADSISDSMISIYEEHKKDLKDLKKILEPYPKKRKKVLNEIYEGYIHKPNKNSKDDFYKRINEELKDISSAKSILTKIENDEFLKKQNTTDNGEIPYQLHYEEAEKIIDNQSKYYDCLAKNREKILSIISFRRPYYLGPSRGGDNKETQWSWMVRKDENDTKPLRPWNWRSIIDEDETAKLFIDRMRNHCSYLLHEETLPKNSILLNRFNLLNELNKVRIDGKVVFRKKEEKEEVIRSLFLKKGKITTKDLLSWLVDHQRLLACKDHIVTGTQAEDCFSSNLKTEISIRKILGDKFDSNISEIEKIIDFITVYNEKDIITRKIRKEISFELTDNEVSELVNLKLKGYGRLSKKLIDELLSYDSKTIMGYLYETNDNFMQILNKSEYGFMEKISEENITNNSGTELDIVDDLTTSPANKRAIRQSLRVVEDIVKYMKHNPSAIYIEFARGEGKKERSTSRFSKLEKIYKKYCDNELQDELKKYEKAISDDRVYLYFIQQGKCLYSGKKLELTELDKYQVDHILPQTYIKDDSLENLALVYSSENQRKKDNLLLEEDIILKNRNRWKTLYEQNLIGQKKYHNLTRTIVSSNESTGFVARQLVETRQICIHVRDILKNKYQNTEIASVHASLSSEFRHKYKLYKIRNLNSAHHANDAFLVAMIGKFIKKEMPYLFSDGKIETRYINRIIKERLEEEVNESKKAPEKTIYTIAINKMNNNILCDENGEIYWGGSKQIAYIKKIFGLKSYFYNYQTRDYDGSLYNATLYPSVKNNRKTKASVNIKNNMPIEKYGGYSTIENAYGMAIEYSKGKKTIREVVNIPVMNTSNFEKYLVDLTGDKNVKVVTTIKMNQSFIKDGCLFTMASASEWNIREPIYLNSEQIELLYKLQKGRYELYTREQLLKLMLEILAKVYEYIPMLRKQINDKFGENRKESFTDNASTNKVVESLFEGKTEEVIANSILKLLECITSKTHPDFKIDGKTIVSRFGRLSSKTIKLDEVEFVFTSPSGIFKTVRKL